VEGASIKFTTDNQYVKINRPATNEQVQEVERKFEISLPNDLKSLLFVLNGDDCLIFSTQQIIKINLMVRKMILEDLDEENYQPVE